MKIDKSGVKILVRTISSFIILKHQEYRLAYPNASLVDVMKYVDECTQKEIEDYLIFYED